MKTYAIIPAGGSGRRFGSEIPKQFLEVEGKPIIAFALEPFQQSHLIDEIIIATHRNYFDLIEKIKLHFKLTKISKIVEGGKERQDSVFNSLKAIENAQENDFVITHDAVRPLLTVELLDRCLLFAKEKGSAIVVKKVNNTLLEGEAIVEKYLNRNKIYSVETPQIFKYSILMNAFKKAYEENFYGTDESGLVFRASNKVNLFETNEINFKITTQTDLKLLKFFLNLRFK